MQARALVKERIQRTLFLLVDGSKSEEVLLAAVAGTRAEDFKTLQALGLIAPAQGGGRPSSRAPTAPAPLDALPPAGPAPASAGELDYNTFTATLTQMISKELGLRGFPLTLAVEKAGTIAELQAVAQRTLDQIRDRKGEAAAAAARRTLYGG
jgi:hypothetical protein